MSTGNKGKFSERLKRILFWKRKKNAARVESLKETPIYDKIKFLDKRQGEKSE